MVQLSEVWESAEGMFGHEACGDVTLACGGRYWACQRAIVDRARAQGVWTRNESLLALLMEAAHSRKESSFMGKSSL